MSAGRRSGLAGGPEGPDKSGLSGHLLSFALPAIFCHPFALLFSDDGNGPQSILVGGDLYRGRPAPREGGHGIGAGMRGEGTR